MALNATTLKNLIISNLEALGGSRTGNIDEDGIGAIASAIVSHITSAGVVTVNNATGLVDSAGNPPSPTHTGSATGIIT